MKKYFVVSLVKNGILGGGIVADSEAITYHTGKITVPNEYRHLEMKYKDIHKVTTDRLFVLPTVLIKMKNGKEFKFVVFFNRKRFLNVLRNMGVAVIQCHGIILTPCQAEKTDENSEIHNAIVSGTATYVLKYSAKTERKWIKVKKLNNRIK